MVWEFGFGSRCETRGRVKQDGRTELHDEIWPEEMRGRKRRKLTAMGGTKKRSTHGKCAGL